MEPNYKVLFFKKENGDAPAKVFLMDLEPKMRAKLSRAIAALQINGPELREPYSKHLDDGIFELRAQIGNNISRVLFFFVIDKRAVLTHGFMKKTQKTPPSEIEKAKIYRDEYLTREANTDVDI
jgi:phage-related protein